MRSVSVNDIKVDSITGKFDFDDHSGGNTQLPTAIRRPVDASGVVGAGDRSTAVEHGPSASGT